MTVVLVLAVGVALTGGYVAMDRLALRVVTPSRRLPEQPIAEMGLDHDEVVIRSGDVDLAGWLLHGRDVTPDAPLVVLAHGWGASHGTTLLLAEPLQEAGHDVLVFDVRGHGVNASARYVTVRHFREDVVAALRFARDRFPGRKIVLVGHSLGGSAGVLAAAERAPVDGLVLIAAPADVLTVTADFLNDQGLPGNMMVRVLRPFWWPKVGGSFRPLTPSRRIGELKLPMLMLQPENDQRVHRRHADVLARASGIEYHLIGDCEHTDVLAASETVAMVSDFVTRVGGGTAG